MRARSLAGRFWLFSRCGLAALLIASLAPAQAGSSEAEKLFYDGRKLLESQEYDDACEKLEQSQKLDPGLGTLALLAYCHEMQGRTATAYAEYSEAVGWAEREGDAERQRAIEQQRDRLKARLSTLRVLVPQPVEGLEVHRAGQKVPREQWGVPVPIDPGTVVVEASAPGYRSWTGNVSVGSEGERADVSVPELVPEEETSEATKPGLKLDPPVLIAFGVGAVGLGVGTFFGLRAKSLKDDSDDAGCDSSSVCTQEGYDLRNDARSSARVANIAFGIGLAGAAAGVVLLLTRKDAEKPAPAAALRIVPSPRGAWASLEHRF
jgi:hypothetical protein